MSTNPCSLYVNYLTTDALVRSIERIERKLSTRNPQLTPRQRELLLGVREDLARALASRQLKLAVGPAQGRVSR